jgi:hypothetical protein
MKIVPTEEFNLETNLTEEEVANRIKNIIETRKSDFVIFKNKFSKPYSGYIRNNKFEIKRNIEGRNSFVPNICGIIVVEKNKIVINIKMKLDEIVVGFSIFWLSFVSLFFIIGIFVTIMDIKNIMFIIVPIFMWFFGYCLINGSFDSEKYNSKEYLKKILEATEKIIIK